MLTKLTIRLEELLSEGRIKTKWSALEDLGIAELVHVIFENHMVHDSIATTAIVENNVIYLHLYEGIFYEHEGEIYTLARALIDTDSNIVFEATSGALFLFETDFIDAEDPKHYFGND